MLGRPMSAEDREENLMLELIPVVAHFLNLTLVFALRNVSFVYSLNNISHSPLNWGIVLFIIKSIFSKHFSKTQKKVKHF